VCVRACVRVCVRACVQRGSGAANVDCVVDSVVSVTADNASPLTEHTEAMRTTAEAESDVDDVGDECVQSLDAEGCNAEQADAAVTSAAEPDRVASAGDAGDGRNDSVDDDEDESVIMSLSCLSVNDNTDAAAAGEGVDALLIPPGVASEQQCQSASVTVEHHSNNDVNDINASVATTHLDSSSAVADQR